MEKQNTWLAITGGSKGIGKAILETFVAEGFHVITCARSVQSLAQLKREIDEKYGSGRIVYLEADVSEQSGCQLFCDFVKENAPSLDVLVNNAGLFLPGQIQNEPEGTLEHLMKTNLYSAYHVTRGLLPLFVQQQKGHIFSICSTASIMPYLNGGSYCISKHALLGFNKVLREEMKAHGVKVTSVLPGATLTDSWEGVDVPAERFMKPEDVAQAIWACWKLSPQTVIEELLIRPQLGDI
jgi:short-subunit dehydrogenase